MTKNFIEYIYECFQQLIKEYKFKIKTEVNEGEYFMIEYDSGEFVINIENYYRDVYVILYRNGISKSERQINLFLLLEYIKQKDVEFPKAKYFKREKNLEKCYKKQIAYILSVIYDNYNLIRDFFVADNYELKIIDLDKYWKNKHPEFYETI